MEFHTSTPKPRDFQAGGSSTPTRGWGKLERPLYDQALDLTGKPDYLVQQNGQIIPVEVKSGRRPAGAV